MELTLFIPSRTPHWFPQMMCVPLDLLLILKEIFPLAFL